MAFWACQPSPESGTVRAVDASEFQKEMAQHPEAILLDIRTPREIVSGKIEGAVEIDYYRSDFEEQVNKLDRTKPLFVYCAVGGRSQSVLPVLQKAGFKEIYHLSSGVQGWIQAGYPLEK